MNDDVVVSHAADDAMRDGLLIEIEKEFTQEAGFKWPVKITQGVVNLVKPSKEAVKRGQSFEGRIWDMLNLARIATAKAPKTEPLVVFWITLQNGPGKQIETTLWAALDIANGPAIHIMKPEEFDSIHPMQGGM